MTSAKWLPELPPGWRVARLQHLAATSTSNVDKHSVEGQTAVRLCNYVDVYKNDVIAPDLDLMTATATPEQIARFALRRGDVVITKDSETPDDIGVPAFVAEAAPDLVCGYHLSIVRPHERVTDPRFLFWLLASDVARAQWGVLATGVTRVGLKTGDIARLQVPLPPVRQQRAIADYLDRETAQIDILIEEQQRLRELLSERRNSAIVSAISGVSGRAAVPQDDPYFPRLPKGWTLARIKSISTRVTDGAHISPVTEGGEHDFVSTKDIRNGSVARDKCLMTDRDSYEYMVRTGCQPLTGDVLFSKDGTVGEVALVEEQSPFVVASSLVIVRPDPRRMAPRFLAYALRSRPALEQARSFMRGAGLPRLSVANLARVKVPVPSMQEQEVIADALDAELTKLGALDDAASELMRLAEERRAALITAAVTGQIDVGDAA